MDINFKLETFEGPLDLLLHLIEKNKIDIYDIPIVEITDQYMDYIRAMQEANLDIMSEFMLMAATLLDIKSRMLLPVIETEDEEEAEDPRTELVEQLLEYKMYKSMSYELRDRQMDATKFFYKAPTIPDEVLKYQVPVDLNDLVEDLTLNQLNNIFNQVIRRCDDRVDPVRSKFGRIKKEEVSMDDKLIYVKDFAKSHKSFSFRQLLESASTKSEIIVTFLVILELMKAGDIFISQEKIFDDISIESKIAA